MKGKKYTTVAMRVEVFRKYFSDYSVNTRVTVDDGKRVVVVAEIYPPKAERPVATGIAEEIRGAGNVNRTSAVENGETSAIGRALANLGLHGGEFASDFEIEVAELKDATMDMNEAVAKARKKKKMQQWQSCGKKARAFRTMLMKKKLLAKTTRYFKSSLIAWSKNLSLQNLSGR